MTRRRRSRLQSAYTLDASGLGGRVVRGAGFQFLGIVLRTVVTIGSTAALARLLSPSDFGFVAMATVVTELAALFANFGFSNLLIQRRRIGRLQVDTVFWASVLLGCLLAVAVFVLSFAAGSLFQEERVGPLLRVLCLTFVLSGLPTVAWIVLARRMQFHLDFAIQMVVVVGRTAVAIGLAWWSMGAWALVAGAVAGALLQAVLAFVIVPYKPRFRFDASFLTTRWRTSGGYFGGGLLFYANMNVDLVLIGRALGAAPLGYYQNARSLTDEIRARIAMPLQQVLFPAFSAVQHDAPMLARLVGRSGRMIAAIVVPIGVGVAALAPELVRTLYGERWLAMTPVMGMFGLSAAVRAATALATPIFNATDRVSLSFKLSLVGTALTLCTVAATSPLGIEAVATGIAAVSLYSLLPYGIALRLVRLSGAQIAAMLLGPMAASAVLYGAVWTTRPILAVWSDLPVVQLLLGCLVGAVGYLIALAMLSRQHLADFHQLIRRGSAQPAGERG